MKQKLLIRKIDFIVFIIILCVIALTFRNREVTTKIDKSFLPEERNPGYYEILNNKGKAYISNELYEKGTDNLLINALPSGPRAAGYSINVNTDGSFVVSGSYEGENDIYEYPMSTDKRLKLPAGNYVLSDGVASSDSGISLRIIGIQHLIGGETRYITVACLPEQPTFHWDGDDNTELIVDMVIRPGFKADDLTLYPMLLKTEEVSEDADKNASKKDISKSQSEYQPCLAQGYNWDNDGNTSHFRYYEYGIPKGAIDEEVITESDWKLFTNTIKYQIQEERVLIDLLDGTAIDINKKEFPKALYGKLDSTRRVREGKEIKITDFSNMKTKQSETELHKIRDFYDYLKDLEKTDYTVFVSIGNDGVSALNHGSFELLKKLGVQAQLIERDDGDIRIIKNYQNSFCGIFKQGKPWKKG